MSEYPTSTINIYQVCDIIKEKNLIVDDIEDYLNSLPLQQSISNFQYIKHSFNLQIKLPRNEAVHDSTLRLQTLKYIRIKNSGTSERPYYYFVNKVIPRATDTILLELEMDVLNTFKWNSDYVVSKRTNVLREHKDRYVLKNGYYYPIVDFYSEGIQAPLYKKSEDELIERYNDNHWYLIYKNRSNPTEANPTPIDCYLCPKTAFNVIAKGNAVLTPAIVGNNYYIFCSEHNDNIETYISWNNGADFMSTSHVLQDRENGYYDVLIVYTSSGSLKVKKQRLNLVNGDLYLGNVLEDVVAGNEVYVELANSPSSVIRYRLDDEWPLGDTEDALINNATLTQVDTEYTLKTLDDVDRTDILLNKIIAIPYFPSNSTRVGSVMKVPDEWEYDSGTNFLKLKNLNTKFENICETTKSNVIKEFFVGNRHASFTDGTRDDTYEPKVFHSDFYQYKFVYDSFNYIFPLECVDLDTILANMRNFLFRFVVSNTMNSRFLFKFAYKNLYIQEDYDNLLSVARNNEVVIYNSPYLNYLRTSYNYDVKAKERSVFTSQLSTGLGVAGQGLGIGLSLASGNPAVAIQGVLSGTTGIVSSLFNSMNSIIQAEENFKRKQDEMKVQGVSVAGADDLDLLEYYSNNRAKLTSYGVSTKIFNLLQDLFYYTGYNTNEFKIPDVNTRRQFNFLQCELKLVGESSSSTTIRYIPDDCLNTIISKFSEGATFIHHYNNTWDIDQTSSNFERSTL